MPCYFPLTGYVSRKPNASGKFPIVFNHNEGYIDRKVQIPCGRCIGCRAETVKKWAVRCVHESKLHDSNCFITLTYDDNHLPVNGTLVKRDFQLFMKRLRKAYSRQKIRFFHCGEYGEKMLRPHYHAILFGFDFDDKELKVTGSGKPIFESKKLLDIWGQGFVSIDEVNYQTCAYVARYVVKKINGDKADDHYQGRIPEYATMSRRPGIGLGWLEKYSSDVYPLDKVVLDGGKIVRPPRYYDEKYSLTDTDRFNKIKGKRLKNARIKKDVPNNRPRRLKERAEYHNYVVEKKRREYEATGV